MTEEEAQTKWCPFARSTVAGSLETSAANRSHLQPEQMNIPLNNLCIASACMAWRATDNYVAPYEPAQPAPEPKSAGHCGLAGQP